MDGKSSTSKKVNKKPEELLDLKMPAATQKLRPLQMKEAAKKPLQKTEEDANNRTALADIPVMLFADEASDEKEADALSQLAEVATGEKNETAPPPLDSSTIQTPSYDSASSKTLAQGSPSGEQGLPPDSGPSRSTSNSPEDFGSSPSQDPRETRTPYLCLNYRCPAH